MERNNNKSSDILLPIYTPLAATSRPQIDILSLFDYESDKNMIWFITYFFSLSMFKGGDILLFTDEITSISLLDNCPLIEKRSYDLKTISRISNTYSEFIFEQINEGYYIYTPIDIYFIEEYIFHYNKTHFPHPMLIYGYNEDKNIIYGQDFFYYALEKKAIKTPQLEAGLKSLNPHMRIACIKKQNHPHLIDFKFILTVIQCHLESKSIYENDIFLLQNSPDRYIFGVNCYDELQKTIQRPIKIGEDINHHTCHAIYDHAKIINALLKYLYRQSYIPEDHEKNEKSKELIDKSLAFQNLCLKYNISKNSAIPHRIIDILSQIKQEEETLLRDIYTDIEIHCKNNTKLLPQYIYRRDDILYSFKNSLNIYEKELNDENIVYTVTKDDPMIVDNAAMIDTSVKKYVYLKFKSTCVSGTAQIFFAQDEPLCENNSVSFTYSPCDEYITYIVDMTCCKSWKETVYLFRFDPAIFNNKNNNGEITLMSIDINDTLPEYNSNTDFCKTQGVNGWFYYSYDHGITYKELVWDNKLWQAHNFEELMITDKYQTSYHNIVSVRKWVCPANGEYEINVEYSQRGNDDLADFTIKYDLQTIYYREYKEKNAKIQGTYETAINMKRGEALFFEFNNASHIANEYLDINITIKKSNNITKL